MGGFGTDAGGPALGVDRRAARDRRVVHSDDGACDPRSRSTALVGEYQRIDVPGTGAANQLGLLVQQDLPRSSQGKDRQATSSRGALATIGGGSGDGVGGELGLGWSLRGRSVPVFGELVGAVLAEHGDTVVRAGVQVGLVW